jgi:hypothetical protein
MPVEKKLLKKNIPIEKIISPRLWEVLIERWEKHGPAIAILEAFHCLKKIGDGDWFSVSNKMFGEHNFFSERLEIIQEAERITKSGVNYAEKIYAVQQVSREEADLRLIPDLLTMILEEDSYKKFAEKRAPKEENTEVYTTERIPNITKQFPFFSKGNLYLIFERPRSNAWNGVLMTIPQMIINIAFSTWLSGEFSNPEFVSKQKIEDMSGGENMIPKLKPFLVERKKGSDINFFNFQIWKNKLFEYIRENNIPSRQVMRARDIFGPSDVDLFLKEKSRDPNFGYLVTLAKLSFPRDYVNTFFQPEYILKRYITAYETILMNMLKASDKDYEIKIPPEIKSAYPKKSEKKKIIFAD